MSAGRAAVVYRSHTGTTERYGRAIAAYLRDAGLDADARSIADCEPASLPGADVVLLGCWTNGWFVVHQHPDVPWVAFARELPSLAGKRLGLFTTYKLVTGSMFARMRDALAHTGATVAVELQSRDGRLSVQDRAALDRLVGGVAG